MKKFSLPRFEGWKTLLITSFTAKLIMDLLHFRACYVVTMDIFRFPEDFSKSDISYAGKFGWFMFVCFAVIILADILMLIRLFLASEYKIHKKQLNTELDLYKKNSRIKAERFCFITMLLLLIPFAFMMGYIDALNEDYLFFAGFTNAVVYIIILADIIKSSYDLSKKNEIRKYKLGFFKAAAAEYDNFAAAFLDAKTIVVRNLTDYMISSFSTGNFLKDRMIFLDKTNELDPLLKDIPSYQYDMEKLINYIVVADCNKISDTEAFVKETYRDFRKSSSKYAFLTIGLVNAKTKISEKDFDFGLAKDISIVSFPSYKVLNLLSLSNAKIPLAREIGTPEENKEIRHILKEIGDGAKEIAKNEALSPEMQEELDREVAEYNEYLKAFPDDTPPPDEEQILMNIMTIDKLKTTRMKSIWFSRMFANYLNGPEPRICSPLISVGLTPEINPDNEYLYSIFKNMVFEPSDVKRIMASFDYIDFILRTVSIYYHMKYGGDAESYEVKSNFEDLAGMILLLSPESETNLRKTIEIPLQLMPIFSFAMTYFNLMPTSCDELDLCGLCQIIDIIRNKTRGHGSVKEENSNILKGFLLFATELLHDFLNIKEFNIFIENNTVFTGYKDERYDCSGVIFAKDNLPCIPIRVQNGKKEYINFFSGRYIVPDFVEV
ncbi:MAG: hypothetical protein IKL70_01810 [Oscillospiraceae bacterium]|nr:hypothetical protein [Oscillospiraceae bacterium]